MLISQLTPKVRWDSTHPLPTRHLSTPSGVTDHWIHLLERLTSISNKNGQNRTLDFPLQKRWTGQKRKRLVLARNFRSLSLERHGEGRDSGGGGKKLIGRCRNRTRFTETLSVLKRDSWEEILWGSGRWKSALSRPALLVRWPYTTALVTWQPLRVPVHHGEESYFAFTVLAFSPSSRIFRSDFSAPLQIALLVAF